MNDISQRQKENIGKAIGVTVSPKITHSVALMGLARHYFGTGLPMVVGGALGYLLGSQTSIDPEKKHQIIQDIMKSREEMNSLSEDNDNQKTDRGIMNSSELLNYQYNKYPFFGKWADFVGQPSVNFHAMIYGRPKQGKSILAVQFAQYLSENFGRVLYIAAEEGFSVTLQKKIQEFAMNNPNLDFANYRNFLQIKEALHIRKYKFVFIDSVNFIKITPEDIEDLKADNKGTAFITIQQATKNGNFRGSQEFAHNCDMVIRVEAGQASHQGRFQEPTEMAVFDKPEQNSQNNKKAPDLGAENSPKNNQLELFSNDDFTEANF